MNQTIRSAEILCVGTEILIGDIVNTNAAYISEKLSQLGINQYYQAAVGDNPERLRECVIAALDRCDLLIMTGGLGPTYDDLTKETVAQVAGTELVLQNDHGTAPGMAIEIPLSRINELNGSSGHAGPAAASAADAGCKTVIMLPGPPKELIPMFENCVMPYLAERTGAVLISKNINIYGRGESAVEAQLAPLMKSADNPTAATYCSDGEVRIRVTARGSDKKECARMCDEMIERIRRTPVGKFIYGTDTSLPQALINEAKAASLKLAAAESCTGGLVAAAITDIPGSSEGFVGGAVTYSNEMKTKLLGVKEDTLRRFGAVSKETAAEMASGVLALTGADIAVSLTGIAGPGGGTAEKPVGLVYIAVASRGVGFDGAEDESLLRSESCVPCAHITDDGVSITVMRCTFPSSRPRAHIRTLAVKAALAALLSAVRKNGSGAACRKIT